MTLSPPLESISSTNRTFEAPSPTLGYTATEKTDLTVKVNLLKPPATMSNKAKYVLVIMETILDAFPYPADQRIENDYRKVHPQPRHPEVKIDILCKVPRRTEPPFFEQRHYIQAAVQLWNSVVESDQYSEETSLQLSIGGVTLGTMFLTFVPASPSAFDPAIEWDPYEYPTLDPDDFDPNDDDSSDDSLGGRISES